MSEELARRDPTDVDATWRIAKGFALSGYFADAKSAEAAFVKVMAGREMGLAPFQAMTGIHVIQGKPVVGAGLLAAMLDKHPEYDYEVEWDPDEKAPTACTVIISKHGKERGRSRFSLDDAKRAGLTQVNWTKYPGAMLFARALSQGVRWYAAGVTGQSVYVEGELGEPAPTPDAPPSNVVATVIPYIDPADPLDDVPFEDSSQNAAPAASNPAESPLPTGPAAAEPAGDFHPGGLLLIDTLEDAQRLVNMLDGPQLGVMKQMLGISEKTTRRLMADALLEQRNGWDAQDVLSEMGGMTA